ncbi:MAG: YifB family Mg chelatase-like AAA ATPase [Oscillospiraceae bacterium]|nr:YifB family Mg chelatase-like AAA ATPase [Oscillospiraceae bacterium]
MFSKVNSVGLFGLNAFPVTVEASISAGQPSFDIVGMPDVAVQESKARIRAVLGQLGLKLLGGKVTVNLAPASVKKIGSMFDLPITMALMLLGGVVEGSFDDTAFIGELSLDGTLAPVNGALGMVLAAAQNGIKRVFLPIDNAKEASVAEGMEIYGAEHITQITDFLQNGTGLAPEPRYIPSERRYRNFEDFADVMGQYGAKKAIETAAAGSHNLLMLGPPGSGKSMLAKRIPSILPRITFEESIETTQIHSVAGLINPSEPLITSRPFRAVSHTASSVGLVGGGSVPRPGEISLAHNGVLFLDELPEFDRRVLETLRQPLENGEITISRASGSVNYPCDVMMVAAMNPCPCGNFGNPLKKCTCSEKQVSAYLNKISQPVLDRIDIQIEIRPVKYDDLAERKPAESSAAIAERVQRARDIQAERYKGTDIKSNSRITSDIIAEVCNLAPDAREMLKAAFDKLGLSARAYDRILKVSRTCADLDGSADILKSHVSQAISFRSLDRKYWNR